MRELVKIEFVLFINMRKKYKIYIKLNPEFKFYESLKQKGFPDYWETDWTFKEIGSFQEEDAIAEALEEYSNFLGFSDTYGKIFNLPYSYFNDSEENFNKFHDDINNYYMDILELDQFTNAFECWHKEANKK